MRQKIEELLSRQYSAKSPAEYVETWLQILHLVSGIAELDPAWKPSPAIRPLPARKSVVTMEDLTEAKATLAQMLARGDRYSDDFHWLSSQVRASEGIILERAQRA